jgi:hypothetical protein
MTPHPILHLGSHPVTLLIELSAAATKLTKVHTMRRDLGRAVARKVSRWLPTAAARVWSCGICGGQSDTGAGFLRVLRFPLPIISPTDSSSSSSFIIGGWYNWSVMASIIVNLVLLHPKKEKEERRELYFEKNKKEIKKNSRVV